MSEASVVATRQGRIGHLLLNRPKALNALDLDMIRRMRAALDNWRDDPSVQAVVVEGAGGRAYSAGGDVISVRASAIAGDPEPIESFFSEEYALNAAIAEYPKPYISLVDGFCMGGGIGLSVHGRMVITTATSLFAMPETIIALFPDVGGSYALPRMPGQLGLYLGLTGLRLSGADAVHAGLATHLVAKDDLPALREALSADGPACVAGFAQALPPFTLAPHRATIDRCFGAGSVPAIFAALEAETTDWAAATLKELRAVSPLSIYWSFEILRRGATLSLRAALHEELKLTRRVAMHPEFHEGVRAALVDKDRKPQWNPARIEDVDPAAIAAMFE
jgi:enoyl-CoA hydratase/carnithine racemase